MNFPFLIEQELRRQEAGRQQSEKILEKSPPGYIRMAQRKTTPVFYQVMKHGGEREERNISDKPQVIRQLLEKQIQKRLRKVYVRNIEALKAVKDKFCDTNRKTIV